MAIIDHIDGPTRRIFLDDGVVTLDDLLAFYREYRVIRRINEEIRQYDPFLTVYGGQSKGGGKLVGRYIDLHDVKIVPQNTNHSLLVQYEIIDTINQLSGRDVFDRSLLDTGVDVDIDIVIAPVEIIRVETGSGLSVEQDETITENNEAILQTLALLQSMNQLENARWRIIDNQLVFYDVDNTTPLKRFDLFDREGNPTEENVFDRVPV